MRRRGPVGAGLASPDDSTRTRHLIVLLVVGAALSCLFFFFFFARAEAECACYCYCWSCWRQDCPVMSAGHLMRRTGAEQTASWHKTRAAPPRVLVLGRDAMATAREVIGSNEALALARHAPSRMKRSILLRLQRASCSCPTPPVTFRHSSSSQQPPPPLGSSGAQALSGSNVSAASSSCRTIRVMQPPTTNWVDLRRESQKQTNTRWAGTACYQAQRGWKCEWIPIYLYDTQRVMPKGP